MYSFKLLGLALSALMTVTPVNFVHDIDYPFTRTDRVAYRISADVDDLGDNTPLGLVGQHNYNITYNVDLFCSSSCSYVAVLDNSSSRNISDTHIRITYRTTKTNYTPSQLVTFLNNMSSNGIAAQVNTYTSEDSIGNVAVNFTLSSALTVNVKFMAENNQMLLSDIAYNLRQFKYDYEILHEQELIMKLVYDVDVPSDYKETVIEYYNNGDYSTAYEYVENYYMNNSVNETETNETIVNNYNSKDNTLNNYFDTENNFTNSVQTDFQNHENNLPDTAYSISEFQSQGFPAAANWVTTQFNRMTDNGHGTLLKFSLFTGFILALIGRFKK